MKAKPTYLIMTASASMPSSCKGSYSRIALVELEQGFTERPKMISTRAKGLKRIVAEWGPVPSRYKTERAGFPQAMKEAEALKTKLENE